MRMNTDQKNRPRPAQKENPKPQAMDSYNFSKSYRLRQSFLVPAFRLIALEFVFAGGIWLFYRFFGFLQIDETLFFNASFWIFQIINLSAILIIILMWSTTYYILSPNAILKSEGILSDRKSVVQGKSVGSAAGRATAHTQP